MNILDFNIARLHPLLVHLPIGLLFLAMVMEGLQRWCKHRAYQPAIGLSLLLGSLSAIVSALTGWWLGGEGGYDAVLLNRHRWLGVATACLAALAYLGHQGYGSLLSRLYPYLLLASGVLLFATGHLGGAMTHGEDYLFSKPKPAAVVADLAAANAFEVLIQPILEAKCVACHKPSKSKGGLVMSDAAGLLAGGENGPIFHREVPSDSPLLLRVKLPMEAEAHMPPSGKPQLTADELRLLEWWVENKACFDCTVGEMAGQSEVQAILDRYAAPADHWQALGLPPISVAKLEQLRAKGLQVQLLADNSPFLLVNLARDTGIAADKLRALRQVAEHVLELDLSHSDASDELSQELAQFAHLKKLSLQGTRITDQGLPALQPLQHLQSLNLYGTAVSDDGLQVLSGLESLQQLYLWQTQVSENGAAAFAAARPGCQVHHAIDEAMLGSAQLNPPEIEAASTLFVDSVVVRLRRPLRGASAFYTLDGEAPDSSAARFPDSLVLRASALLKVRLAKPGWTASPVATQHFFKAGVKAKQAALREPPSGKFQAEGAASLIDLQKGTEAFTAGHWLGYEGRHCQATLALESPTLLSEVAISALSRPASWIFFPVGAKISVSMDGRSYRQVGRAAWPATDQEVGDAEMRYFPVTFPPVQALWVRVEVESPLRNPDWHAAPGGDSWLFLDEVLLK